MLTPQHPLDLAAEIIVDLFAGGGGASTGIEQALGYPPHIAINHDPEAVALHQANHPQTRHFVSDVFEVDPVAVTEGRAVGLLWASPDCKHFSKAKGGKPVSKKIRSLAWVVVKWARLVRPRVICLENVEEFQTWGPLGADDRPCPLRKGRTFRRWKRSLERLGYAIEHRELRACDYGAPTIRKRLFLVARRDGAPIVWPEPTHAAPASLALRAKKLKPWRTAAECIDWSIACPSIFERRKELADATKRRIAKGVMRYVVEAQKPFIVPLTHQGGERLESIDAPFKTITGAHRGERALVAPSLIAIDNAGARTATWSAADPLRTSTTENRHALVTAFLAKHYTGVVGSDVRDPLAIVDIGLRMLAPRELYRAQGFPESYIIDRGADGRVMTKTAQVRMCGNSVCPPLARAIVAANYAEPQMLREAA
jgi:DNA (cytosine-5)-methyltransferase 1